MSRPIPGTPSLEFRSDGVAYQRCSRCHRRKPLSRLVLDTVRNSIEQLHPIMVGNDLVGVICSQCVLAVERHIMSIFPDAHAFPFVDSHGVLMGNPRCEQGHSLVYADDGQSMACEQCDVTPALPEPSFIGPVSD